MKGPGFLNQVPSLGRGRCGAIFAFGFEPCEELYTVRAFGAEGSVLEVQGLM